MWTYPAYRWPDEASGRAAIAAEGWAEGTPPEVQLLVIGTWAPPVAEDEEPAEPLPGWWLAAAFRDRAPPAAWSVARAVLPVGAPRLGVDDLLGPYQVALDALVQATARRRGYNGAATCASYALDPNEVWAAEAHAFIAWRSAGYQQAFATLAAVEAGEIPPPSVEDFVASIPAIVWPEAAP